MTETEIIVMRGLFAAACNATGYDQGRFGGPADYLGDRWKYTVRGILRNAAKQQGPLVALVAEGAA